MYRFIETIKLRNGVFFRLNFHQERVNNAFASFFPNDQPICVDEILHQATFPTDGLYKCRIVYDSKLQLLEFVPYTRKEIRTLKLIETTLESHAFKSENRTEFNTAFSLKGNCDDVLLVRNGLLTDTSYCNIALFDGEKWFTPKVPLLYGVNRADLIEKAIIHEKDIRVEDLKHFQQITLFNAMIEFGELMVNVSDVVLMH